MSLSGWAEVFLRLLFLFSLRALIVIGLARRWVASAWSKRHRVNEAPLRIRQEFGETMAAVRVSLFDAAVAAIAHVSGAWSFARPTWESHLLTAVLLFILYEVWFYGAHRMLHTRLLFRFHLLHHLSRTSTPLTALTFSLVERGVLQAGAIGISAGLSRIVPVTELGVVAYFFLNFVLNVWAHSNVEVMPRSFDRTTLGRVFITTTYHADHHRWLSVNYGLFTQTLDRLFGTKKIIPRNSAPFLPARNSQGDL